jgi:hypothetical protein
MQTIAAIMIYTGYIPALVLCLFKKFGDGTGNESGMAEFFGWALGFGITIWILTIIGFSWTIYNFYLAG